MEQREDLVLFSNLRNFWQNASVNPEKFKVSMSGIICFLGVVGPVMTLPQLFKIWVEQNAAGVSMISWVTYLVTGIVWLMYGIALKEKPIILTYSIWVVLELFIVTGIFLYG